MYVCAVDDEWEVPFENISDLTWLGSGSQGAVFLGRLGHDQVAVKKVRDVKETDVKHLRRLNHPNVVSIRYILLTCAYLRASTLDIDMSLIVVSM